MVTESSSDFDDSKIGEPDETCTKAYSPLGELTTELYSGPSSATFSRACSNRDLLGRINQVTKGATYPDYGSGRDGHARATAHRLCGSSNDDCDGAQRSNLA